MFRKYKTLKHPNAGSIPQPKLSKLKMRFFSTVLIVHVLLCGCNVQPLTIEEIMAKAGSNTYVTIVQSDFRQNAIIKDSTESIEYVNIRDVDTIQLNKILGFNSNERIIIFSREGIYNTYPPISNKDKAKINNSIQLSRMLAQNKNIPSEPIDVFINKYNIYGLYLLFTKTMYSPQKDSIAEYMWFNSTKEEKRIYDKECLESYKYIYQHSNKKNIIFAHDNYHFKNIPLDTIINIAYPFKNIGNDKALIEYVTASCNCTNVFYPKRPIPSKRQDSIKIRYKPKSQGYNSSDIVVKFLYHKPIKLSISCNTK